ELITLPATAKEPITLPAAPRESNQLGVVPLDAKNPPASPYAGLKPVEATNAEFTNARPGRQSPAVSIEWIAPSTARTHQPLPCQIIVKNTSNVPVHNVAVRHRIGQGVSCVSSEPRASQESDELAWNLGTLAPEQVRRIDLVLESKDRGL